MIQPSKTKFENNSIRIFNELFDSQRLVLLDMYEVDGWLRSQDHPTLPLRIWNYTEKTQFEGKWDTVTRSCRGLVTTVDGKIIARPFPKFWNIEENKHSPTEKFSVSKKLDGSLGIVFYYEGELIFATRGSFISDQAVKAREIFTKSKINILNPDFTYLFEIIYPENRVVVRYEEEKLILLGIINPQTGEEVPRYDWDFYIENVEWVPEIYCTDYTTLKSLNTQGEEGFVVRFSNGDRCKIKFEDYVRLHKIMTCMSTTAIWEMLFFNKSINEALVGVPDEFYAVIKEYYDGLVEQYEFIVRDYKEIFAAIYTPNRKKFAEIVQRDRGIKHPQLLYQLYDKRNIRESVLKLIKPEFRKL